MIETACTLDLPQLRQVELLTFAYSASKIDGNAIGWLPRTAYDQAHEAGRMASCYNNNDLVGFVIFGFSLSDLRVYQIWVRKDARMIEHGRALVAWMNALAWRRGAINIGLWCAEDLAANIFWKTLGFINTNWRWGRAKKARRHRHWIIRTHDPRLDLPERDKIFSPSTASAR